MFSVILYVMLCATPDFCEEYEPESWVALSSVQADRALDMCARIERKWMKHPLHQESDCFVQRK